MSRTLTSVPTDSHFAAEFLAAIRSILPEQRATYSLHEPHFAGNEWGAVKDCLDSGWVSSAGAYVSRFETRLQEVTGVRRAIATVNGTAALHLCLIAAGVEPGDEVLVPTLTFAATANAVAYCGAVPHFVDCARETLGVDPEKLRAHLETVAERRGGTLINRESGRRIAALLVTHVFGHPADLDVLAEVCATFGLPLIEDAAEALGTLYKGHHVGGQGRLAALSFNGNKIITTGGGGAVLTQDEALAGRVRHLSTTAKQAHAWRFDHDAVGYNYRMPNLNAALGCAQLEQLEGFIEIKRTLAARYVTAFEGVTGVKMVQEPAFARSNCWLNAITLDVANEARLEVLLGALHAENIQARPAWTPMHRLPMFAEAPHMDLSVAEDLAARLICLPSSVALMSESANAPG